MQAIPTQLFCQRSISANRNQSFPCRIWYSLCGPKLFEVMPGVTIPLKSKFDMIKIHQFQLLWALFSWKNVKFEIIKEVAVQSSLFWYITSCRPLKARRCFGETCRGRHYARSRNVTGSRSDEKFSIYLVLLAAINPGFTQPLTEMSTRNRNIILLGSYVFPACKADKLNAM
jgi:hypothetical protein